MKKWYMVAAVAAVTALAITGCGRSSSPTSGAAGGTSGAAAGSAAASGSGAGASAPKGTITMWAMGTEGDKLSVLAKDFEAANPGTSVKVTAVPWASAHDKFTTAIASHTTPDLAMVGTTWMSEFGKQGAFLTPPADIDKSTFFPGAWDSCVVNGTAYGIPWYVETRILIYRADMAKAAGVEAPKTWDDYLAFSKALQDKGGAKWGTFMPSAAKITPSDHVIPMFWSAGGEFLNSSGGFDLGSTPMVDTLTYYQKFFTDKLTDTDINANVDQEFVDGKTGSFISGPWEISNLLTTGGDSFKSKIAVALAPMDKTQTSIMGGSDLAVFKDSKNADLAWAFAKYLSQPEVQMKWYQTVQDLPAVQSAWDDPTLANDPFLSVFGEQLKTAKAAPAIPTYQQITALMDTEIEKVSKGGSPADAAAKIQQEASKIGTGL